MRWIIGTSLKLRFMVIIIAAVLLLFGVSQVRSMPVDVYPEFDPPLVVVQTEALGLSAAEMEALITVPLEADLLNGVAWLDQIYSETVAGLSSILLVFEPGTDPIRARLMVQERLTQTFALPNVSSPPTMLQPLSTTSRAMIVGISSDKLSLLDLGVLARWVIRPRLTGVPGVSNVAVWGHRDRQLQVLVDPQRLDANDVTLRQIIETTGDALWVSPLTYLESSSPGTAGWIDTPNQRLSIRHELPISSAEELAQVAIVRGKGLVVGDVADVVEDHQPLIGDAAFNDTPGLLLVIEKFPGANTLEVTRGIEEALQAMAPGLQGVEIDSTIFRPANYIETAIGNLGTAVLIGAVLVILVLGAFFFQWRAALISLVVIPLSLALAAFVLYLRGETFNTMILAGMVMALGVIIDNAIVDVENITRRFRQHRQEGSDESAMSIVLKAALEIRNPLTFALLIILLAVVPIFFIPNLAGAFFSPLVVSYVLALFTSLLVALIVTPALSVILLAGAPLGGRESPVAKRLQAAYHGILARTVHAPNKAIILAGVVTVLGLLALPFLRVSLLPSFEQRDMLIEWEAAPGTSRLEMNRIADRVADELRSLPAVRNVGSHVGRAITGDAVVGINSGQIWLSLDPAADYDTATAAVQDVVDSYPGLFRTLQTYQPERTAEALTGADEDLVVRVYGHELDVLYDQAEVVRQSIAGIGGIDEVRADRLAEEPQVEIEVDLVAAERNQIKPGDVRRQVTTLLSGLRVGSLYEENKVFDVVVWGVPKLRNSLNAIHDLLITTPDGQVPLAELADVRIVPSPIIIKRDVVSRFVDVTVNVSGRDVAAVAADIKSSLQNVDFPLEYHAEVFGATADQQGTQQRIISIAVTAVVGILLLMQASYGSWRLAFVTWLTLPTALAGGALAALIGGGLLSIGSLFGFFTILGIAVSNSAVLIRRYQDLEQYEGETFGSELVLRGAQERLTPILMTALATALALVTVIIAGDIAGYEILQPMTVVILGGLVTTTLLNLFILPTLYLRFGFRTAAANAEPVGELAFGMDGRGD
jgi:CzcA family heavy metal efflux pump